MRGETAAPNSIHIGMYYDLMATCPEQLARVPSKCCFIFYSLSSTSMYSCYLVARLGDSASRFARRRITFDSYQT